MNLWQVYLLSYLIGSIPFGVIMARLHGKDIFKIGSGSMGTTNVIRACGLWPGLAVMFLDVLKGYAAVILALKYLSDPWLIVMAGIMAMVGHSLSVFIKFRGGKSAATGMGILLALNWQIFLIVTLIVIAVRQFSGYQSLASLIGSFCAPLFFLLYMEPLPYTILVLVGAFFVWLKHIPNIKRLLKGEESKITRKKSKGL